MAQTVGVSSDRRHADGGRLEGLAVQRVPAVAVAVAPAPLLARAVAAHCLHAAAGSRAHRTLREHPRQRCSWPLRRRLLSLSFLLWGCKIGYPGSGCNGRAEVMCSHGVFPARPHQDGTKGDTLSMPTRHAWGRRHWLAMVVLAVATGSGGLVTADDLDAELGAHETLDDHRRGVDHWTPAQVAHWLQKEGIGPWHEREYAAAVIDHDLDGHLLLSLDPSDILHVLDPAMHQRPADFAQSLAKLEGKLGELRGAIAQNPVDFWEYKVRLCASPSSR